MESKTYFDSSIMNVYLQEKLTLIYHSKLSHRALVTEVTQSGRSANSEPRTY